MFFEQGKGGAHDLVHVVVTVLGKTPGKIDIGFDRHQCRITLEKSFILRPGYWVIRIAIGYGIVTDHGVSECFCAVRCLNSIILV